MTKQTQIRQKLEMLAQKHKLKFGFKMFDFGVSGWFFYKKRGFLHLNTLFVVEIPFHNLANNPRVDCVTIGYEALAKEVETILKEC